MNQTKSFLNPLDNKLYRYYRICRLRECSIEIYTNYKHKIFCSPKHQQLYWQRIREGDRAVVDEVSRQAKEIEKIKEKLKLE